ncbi:MAG: extracellular solute-binding protein [Caldithrix sp.]|nr:extracellular solute-binding protein [Caldithrix sp.]
MYMNRILKYSAFIFWVGVGCLFWWNCAKDDDRKGSRTTVDDETIVFKHFKLANAAEQFDKAIKQFEELHPGVRVIEEVLPSNTNMQHQYYATSLQAGSDEFDVFLIDVIWTPEFSLAGWLEDVSDLVPLEERDAFLQAPIQANTYQGKLYAVPWYVDGGILFYRKDLLQKYNFEPPATFKELTRQAQFILKKEKRDDLYGFLWQGKQYEGLICAANEIIAGFGGDILDAENRLHLTDQKSLQALRWMRDTIHKYKISPDWVTTADEEVTRLSFMNGDCLFLRNWPYCWSFFQRNDSPVKGKVGVALMPTVAGEKGASTLGGWQMAINHYSAKKELARKFVTFMTSAETQLQFALTVGTKPSRKKVYQNARLQEQQPFIVQLYDVLRATRPRPMTPFYPQMSQVLQVEFSAAISKIRPVKQAMAMAEQQIYHILELEERVKQ